jgi:hypothetical protein
MDVVLLLTHALDVVLERAVEAVLRVVLVLALCVRALLCIVPHDVVPTRFTISANV